MSANIKKKISIILNILIGSLSFIVWVFMVVFTAENGELTSNGVSSLKYFTVLSNLFNGLVALIYAGFQIKGKEDRTWLKTLKIVSTSAVGLTFLTVVVFLGSIYGYLSMFSGVNFWLHLALPVGSIINFIFFEVGQKISIKCTLFSMIPPFIYALGYVGNILINGMGESVDGLPPANDFYAFLSWGFPIGILIALVILFATWSICIGLYYAGRANIKHEK